MTDEQVSIRTAQGIVLFRTPLSELQKIGVTPVRNEWGELETTSSIVWAALTKERCNDQDTDTCGS